MGRRRVASLDRTLAIALLLLAEQAAAQPAEQFFARKTVTITIGYTAGGSYDLYGRMVARHLGKHIAGTADADRAEHAGRRQPQGRELSLRGRAQGRHRARGRGRIRRARAGARQSRRAIRRGEVHLCRPGRHQQQHLHAVAHRQGAIARRCQARGDLARRHRPGIDRGDRAAALERAHRHQVQAHQRLSRLERGHARDGTRRGRGRLLVMGGGEGRQSRRGCASARSGSSCRPRRSASPSCRTRRAWARSATPPRTSRCSRFMPAAARSDAR